MTIQLKNAHLYVACAAGLCIGVILSAVTATPIGAASPQTSHLSTACIQPPAPMNLATLTNAQLAMYGLPLRPTNPREMSHWASILGHSKHRVCATTPATGISHHLLQPADGIQPSYSSQENSGNWAGVVAYGYGYERVEGSWQVSETYLDKPDYDSASWVGIGGDSNDGGGVLAQAGSESWSKNGSDYYYLWYQEIDPSICTSCQMVPQQISTNVNPFDSIETIVDDNYSFPGQTYIYVGDMNTSVYFGKRISYGQIVANLPWKQTNGSTAEWIVEKTQSYLDLSHVPGCPVGSPHCITFTPDHAVRNGNDTYIDALPTHSVTMWMNTTELAYPGPIHNSSSAAFFNSYLVLSCSPGKC